MSAVSIKLDESVVIVCLAHASCPFNGRAKGQADCDRRWLYGVGAVVFENVDDLEDLRHRLLEVRRGILTRTGIEAAPRMDDFEKRGWHATKDGPEFSDPLLKEIDGGANFKGHVRFLESPKALGPKVKDAVFDHLFSNLISALCARYRAFESIDVIFEDDQSPKARYVRIFADAGVAPEVARIGTEAKGDPALAMADYSLYAVLKFVARSMEVCPEVDCGDRHKVPVANDVGYSDDGKIELFSHLDGSSYPYRMYLTFVRNMSSIVKLHGPVGLLDSEL